MRTSYPVYSDREIEAVEAYVDWMSDEYDEFYSNRRVKQKKPSVDHQEDDYFYD